MLLSSLKKFKGIAKKWNAHFTLTGPNFQHPAQQKNTGKDAAIDWRLNTRRQAPKSNYLNLLSIYSFSRKTRHQLLTCADRTRCGF